MSTDFLNAAPMVNDHGTRDVSIRTVPQTPLEIPQHLPKLFIFAEKGPVGSNYMDLSSASVTQIYGDNTFDVSGKYYTHQTPFLQTVVAAGNNCVIHRVIPPDAKDVANICFYLDVIAAQVPLYVKGTDGSLTLDSNGDPVQQLDSNGDPITVAGYKVCWVCDYVSVDVGTYQRGLLTQRQGIQVNGAVQSVQYPMFEFAAFSPGEDGLKIALKLYASLVTDLVPFQDNILNDGTAYPYYFQMSRISDPITGKTKPVLNSFGAQYTKFITKENGTDPASGAVIDLKKVVKDQYINLTPDLQTGLGVAYMYQGNINTVASMLYAAERNITDPYRDAVINNAQNNIHALNILSFTSSNGSPYQSIKLVDTQNSVRLTRNTNVFLMGSTDGTMTEDLLDRAVMDDMDNYNNSLHEYNDLVMHPESMIYDSGFSLKAKKTFPKFISRRKDTYVSLSTYAYDAPSTQLADQYSVAIALKTMLELYPESATFGTPVMRGIIVGGSGYLIDSLYIKRVPLLYEVAYKASRYMGASNGAWKNGFCFDRAPLSIVTQIKDTDITWVPTSTRNILWGAGLNFVLNYKVGTQFFPALQTVYENDTSVLNSFFTTVAIAYLNKIAHAAWREFSGSISLTNAQLEEKVNAFVSAQVKDKFDDKFVIIPNATVTELDNLRGYSWTLPIKIYANNMKTVMTTYAESMRMTDLAQ